MVRRRPSVQRSVRAAHRPLIRVHRWQILRSRQALAGQSRAFVQHRRPPLGALPVLDETHGFVTQDARLDGREGAGVPNRVHALEDKRGNVRRPGHRDDSRCTDFIQRAQNRCTTTSRSCGRLADDSRRHDETRVPWIAQAHRQLEQIQPERPRAPYTDRTLVRHALTKRDR